MKLHTSAIITIIIMLSVVLSAVYFVWFSPAAQEKKLTELPDDNINKLSNSLQLTDLFDTPVSLKDFKGSVLVVNSWASWCPFCATELPNLEKLAAQYQSQSVAIIAINRAESKPQIESYLSTLPPLPNVLILQNSDDSYYKSSGGFSMPETVLYDQLGNVVVQIRGIFAVEDLQSRIDDLLQKNSP